MRSLLIACSVIMLCSPAAMCGAGAPPPAVEIRTVRVEVPIAIPCIDKASVPAEPPKVASQLTGDARHDLDLVAGSALRLRQALNEAFALIGPCTK